MYILQNLIENTLVLKLPENLAQPNTIAELWKEISNLTHLSVKAVILDASLVNDCNIFGIALIYRIRQEIESKSIPFQIQNLKPQFQALLDHFSDFELEKIHAEEELTQIESFGKEFEQKINSTIRLVEYIGEISSSFLSLVSSPRNIRWKEVLRISELTGVNALSIIALIGFLLGLIMSFQSAIPMQRFGAEIFVANLVSLSLFRELGPLMTAIIMAGRSGSSFAAEIGTMKVNEELDALTTMGLNPVSFLIIPRLLAAMFVSPLLTLFFNLFGLIGSAIVLVSFGYPLVTFINQASKSVKFKDMFGGLFKSIVFGLLVAAIGCLSGMQTKEGASAVGESTTKAVVAGIIIIAITDGIFAVIFYLLGI